MGSSPFDTDARPHFLLFLPQVLESKLPATMGRAQRREKPDIGNGVRSTHPRRRQNSRYQVHAEGHFSPD